MKSKVISINTKLTGEPILNKVLVPKDGKINYDDLVAFEKLIREKYSIKCPECGSHDFYYHFFGSNFDDQQQSCKKCNTLWKYNEKYKPVILGKINMKEKEITLKKEE